MSTTEPIHSGPAFRVSILGGEQVEAYPHVHAEIDADRRVVHVFSADRQTHYLTIPLERTLIEWTDPTVLQPHLRFPPIGPAGFEQLGEQMQRFVEGMGRGFGPG